MEKLTTLDGTGKAIPKEILMQPTSSSTYASTEDQAYPTNNAGAKHSLSTSSDSSDLQPPKPKSSRIATTHSGSKHKHAQAHSSPIDNTIHSKRIGMFICMYVCSYRIIMCYPFMHCTVL